MKIIMQAHINFSINTVLLSIKMENTIKIKRKGGERKEV